MPPTELVSIRCKCQWAHGTLCRPDDPRLAPGARCGGCRKPYSVSPSWFGAVEWETASVDQLRAVLALLGMPVSMRKLRLGACWVCRTTFDWCRNPRFLEAVAVGEAFADEECSERDRQKAYAYLRDLPHRAYRNDGWWAAGLWCLAPERPANKGADLRSLALPAEWFREAFGNPFAGDRVAPEWRTTTAVALAKEIVARRAFHLFPYLSDALQDAGCETPRVLAHCASQSPHGRGCWLLDGLIGKS